MVVLYKIQERLEEVEFLGIIKVKLFMHFPCLLDLELTILQRSRLLYMGWIGVSNMATRRLCWKLTQSYCAAGSTEILIYLGNMKNQYNKFIK